MPSPFKKGMSKRRFGRAGRPVVVGPGRRFEDGSKRLDEVAIEARARRNKASIGNSKRPGKPAGDLAPRASARAREVANPNARFNRVPALPGRLGLPGKPLPTAPAKKARPRRSFPAPTPVQGSYTAPSRAGEPGKVLSPATGGNSSGVKYPTRTTAKRPNSRAR